jgi:hypothetical protein
LAFAERPVDRKVEKLPTKKIGAKTRIHATSAEKQWQARKVIFLPSFFANSYQPACPRVNFINPHFSVISNLQFSQTVRYQSISQFKQRFSIKT